MNFRYGFLLSIFIFLSVIDPVARASQDPSTGNDHLSKAGEIPEAITESVGDEELTDEQVASLLTRVDRFFIDQDMVNLTVEVDIYRDPSGRLNSKNIRESNPSKLAGLSTIVSHYTYRYPDFYQLKIMGEVLAGSEAPPDRTFFSQILPMPGAPIFTEDVRSRFRIRYEGISKVEEKPAYKIRYWANDPETEFFDYIVYYIDVEKEVITRIESAFDNVWYRGIGEGNFYFDTWKGKYLPIYGHGSVLFYPDRRFIVWGKWYKWQWQSSEEAKSSVDD